MRKSDTSEHPITRHGICYSMPMNNRIHYKQCDVELIIWSVKNLSCLGFAIFVTHIEYMWRYAFKFHVVTQSGICLLMHYVLMTNMLESARWLICLYEISWNQCVRWILIWEYLPIEIPVLWLLYFLLQFYSGSTTSMIKYELNILLVHWRLRL